MVTDRLAVFQLATLIAGRTRAYHRQAVWSPDLLAYDHEFCGWRPIVFLLPQANILGPFQTMGGPESLLRDFLLSIVRIINELGNFFVLFVYVDFKFRPLLSNSGSSL